ncbi:putative hydrolase [Enhygromyxa salina]|uniref:Putative hydrolase n=1 Tax=Enhygromyxa salina TaxID=215803 RepID=A0A0C2D4A5_9BACT|nr:HAD family phosphatase [Enhygromyxa salina]KIG14927.1 putative hydrolase [Enhygromyxa salina]
MLPAAVLLDMDGTLVDSESVYAEAIARYMASRGVELDSRERSFVIGHAWQDIYTELRVAERVGVDLVTMQTGSIAMRGQMRAEGIELTVLDGARELVETLAELDVPTAVVSGSCRAELAEAIELLRIGPRLRMYLGSEDYPRGKPAPDGYLAAADQLEVAPARCLVFEDSWAGIGSGLAAGMRVVATAAANRPPGDPGHQDQNGAHRIVQSLAGIDADFLRAVMLTS